jgi:putative aldouronate transport system permease protein
MKIKSSKSDRVFDIINTTILIILTLLFLMPFWLVLTSSIVSEVERNTRGMMIFLPHSFDLSSYKMILGPGTIIYQAYFNTFVRVAAGTLLNMVVTTLTAFALSKRDLPKRRAITFFFFFTILFNGQASVSSGTLIPTFIMVNQFKMFNSFLALIVPSMVNAWWMLLLRNFFMEIPPSMEESASLDGATPFRTLVSIILPLSLPSLMTIGLFYAVWHWNQWFDAFIYITDYAKMPVQNVLREIVFSTNLTNSNLVRLDAGAPPSEKLKSVTIMVSTIPFLCIYPFIQRYFVKGVMVGSVKG